MKLLLQGHEAVSDECSGDTQGLVTATAVSCAFPSCSACIGSIATALDKVSEVAQIAVQSPDLSATSSQDLFRQKILETAAKA